MWLRWNNPLILSTSMTYPRGVYMGVSKNRGTPKWMVYNNGKSYWNGWFGGTPIFGNTHIDPNLCPNPPPFEEKKTNPSAPLVSNGNETSFAWSWNKNNKSPPKRGWWNHPCMVYFTYMKTIFYYLKTTIHVGKYTSPMDLLGMSIPPRKLTNTGKI